MNLIVEAPASYRAERHYIIEVLLSDFLGLEFEVSLSDRSNTRMSAGGGAEVLVCEHLFATQTSDWLKPSSLPRLPVDTLDVSKEPIDVVMTQAKIPVIYGQRLETGRFVDVGDKRVKLGVDIFGSSFFMLTRYEELVMAYRDPHDRFPASASIACQEGFLTRPIVNEYLEILWTCLGRLWPRLSRRPRKFSVFITHDVDHPLAVLGESWPSAVRASARDLVRRHNPSLALRRLYARAIPHRYDIDPYNTFDFLMSQSEDRNLRSAFFFMSGRTNPAFDGCYSLDMPWIRKLLRTVADRGHEVGLHASYDAALKDGQATKELAKLKQAAALAGVVRDSWGGRQHYLRWQATTTWQLWDDAGLAYDSTLGFADHVGFRCGTCYEYPAFNLATRCALRLRERPLVVMDCSLLESRYMGLSYQEALAMARDLAAACKTHAGEFTLLWHNSYFPRPTDKRFYCELLDTICQS